MTADIHILKTDNGRLEDNHPVIQALKDLFPYQVIRGDWYVYNNDKLNHTRFPKSTNYSFGHRKIRPYLKKLGPDNGYIIGIAIRYEDYDLTETMKNLFNAHSREDLIAFPDEKSALIYFAKLNHIVDQDATPAAVLSKLQEKVTHFGPIQKSQNHYLRALGRTLR